MGRRKIEIKAIKDDRNRSVTFLKRKGGLFKKAHELAVLCSVDVTVIILGHNKKLYQFSSSDIREVLGKYQYWGPPHENKGPSDFMTKTSGDDDDDDDDDEVGGEETTSSKTQEKQQTQGQNRKQPQSQPQVQSQPRTQQQSPPQPQSQPQPPPQSQPQVQPPAHAQNFVPPHLQQQPGYQHMNHAPSASPPMPNGVPFDSRHGTPQPQGVSRPSSRNHVRRISSQYGQHGMPQSHVPAASQAPNGYAYMNNPSMYNPNAQMHHPQRPGQYPTFPHPAMQAPPHPPPQQMAQPPQGPQPHRIPQQHGFHQMQPQMSQPYLPPDQGRHSMPPMVPPEPHPTHQRTMSHPAPPTTQQPSDIKVEGSQSPKPAPVKSRSIFTPIDDQTSVFSRHLMVVGGPQRDSSQQESQDNKAAASHNATTSATLASAPAPAPAPSTQPTSAERSQPISSSVPEPPPPLKPVISRTNSAPVNVKRPRLKVQIPGEQSDGGSATADSSPRDGDQKTSSTPATRPVGDGNPSVVLPPPSPSAGAITSAGAQGPPNPFARPPPPSQSSTTGAFPNGNGQHNSNSSSGNNMDTPISALPSRFVSDALLPSPSSFFPEWGFGRTGPDSNVLPSPLTFPTPSGQTAPGFPPTSKEEESDKKRKSPDWGGESLAKKVKT